MLDYGAIVLSSPEELQDALPIAKEQISDDEAL